MCHCCRDHRDLHSFPTRRSSDLRKRQERGERGREGQVRREAKEQLVSERRNKVFLRQQLHAVRQRLEQPDRRQARSEEHTSELQSQSNLVCRLLLEKKKKKKSR